ncbi:hypothetical protein FHR83_007101 [Actinoplanes campanulatus]|uniref:Head-to-tail adaptor n=1 Tax=Actinoplanes campanulatus TaxID=113559 RepID=A0A7W5ANK7_9ACTN|nr:hypothetical protein [Actinoplanes campanulatus]MBB3099395.1 hypothetical protein [Actinoplanes campanulatus]GGN40175.1 hypothetical protein GCM10010109_68910 [Actinoplanes campanulatus]GID42396.1 hypothetical protein Aca09nite_89020 [Actinoplanes campanulatus]
MDPYATMEELVARLDWEMDEDEERIAASALEDASDEARHHGRDWDAETAPRLVKTLVLKAVIRYLRNPDGYVSSRAGDETLTWSDRGATSGTLQFTRDEIALLKDLAGRRSGIISAQVSAWGTSLHRNRRLGNCEPPGYVPSSEGAHFPLFPSEADNW